MSKIEAFVTFMIMWWLVFYLTLPFGYQKDDSPIPGQANSAPKNAHIRAKMLITTAITAIITLILYLYLR